MMNLNEILTLLSFILSIGMVLDRLLEPPETEYIYKLIQKSHPPYSERYKRIHEGSEKIFNRIYGYNDSDIQRLFWIGIIGSYGVLFCARVSTWVFDINPPTPAFLSRALVVTVSAILLIYGTNISRSFVDISVRLEQKLKLFDDWKLDTAFRVTIIFISINFGTGLIGYVSTLSRLRLILLPVLTVLIAVGILFSIEIARAMFSISDYVVSPRSGIRYRVIAILSVMLSVILYVIAVSFAVNAGEKTLSRIISAAWAISGAMLFLPLGKIILRKIRSVNPIRAMVSSVAFVILSSAVFTSFGVIEWKEIQVGGTIILLYIIFNMFADTISLVETRWLLQQGRDFPPLLLILSLLLDLLLSGLIYLILPVIVGQDLVALFNGIRFAGNDPWIGILFWSTFSTSLFYYMFVVSVLSLQLIERPAYLTKITSSRLRTDKYPMTYISAVCSTILLLTYLFLNLLSTTL